MARNAQDFKLFSKAREAEGAGGIDRIIMARDRNKCDIDCSVMILVVDDELSVLETLKLVLSRGFSVVGALSEAEALEYWSKQNDEIDLAIIDAGLSTHDSGLALAEALKAEKPVLKVLIISALPPGQLGNHRLVKGENYIQKPFGVRELLELVSRLMKP